MGVRNWHELLILIMVQDLDTINLEKFEGSRVTFAKKKERATDRTMFVLRTTGSVGRPVTMEYRGGGFVSPFSLSLYLRLRDSEGFLKRFIFAQPLRCAISSSCHSAESEIAREPTRGWVGAFVEMPKGVFQNSERDRAVSVVVVFA